jgi:opacity protein-like surface antigen
MEETKTKYEFNEVTSQAWLDVFGVNEFSWINTYGKDTCTTCFYANSTDELKNEIREEFNKYTYVNIPLQLGYSLNLGMVSLGLKGGIQTSILGNAKGLYSKKSFIEEGERLYFWKGLEMTTLSRENDMLKPVYFSYMMGGEVKLRLTSKIDVMVGYNYIRSAGNLTKDDYLYSKKYTNQSLQVGLSFYPNRLPILRKLIF